MKFLFYKVINEIMKNLNIQYTVRNSEDKKVSIASDYNLLYMSLFIETTDENIFEIANQINGINDSKKYASGSRSIPPANRKEYNNINLLNKEIMEIRFKFFESLIQNRSNINSVLDNLKKMITDASNISTDDKEQMLLSNNDGIFHTLRETFKNTKTIQIFKILVYSLYYSDKKTPYDDLSSKVSIHPNFVNRQETVSKLHDAFKDNSIVYLCGIRGCGKTEISKKFISENNFYGILVLDYTDDILENIEKENIFSISNSKKDKKTNKELIKDMDFHYLLVIENVTGKLSDDFKDFINSCNCKVLILSSWKPRNERLNIVDVDCFNEEQAYELMSKYTDRFRKDKMLYIAKKLNYHALAMTVYAKAIEQSNLEYDEICNILHESTVSDKMGESVNYENKEAKACEHIKRLFDFTFDNMTEEDKTILRGISLLPTSGVPIKLLHEFTGFRNTDVVYCYLKPMGWLNVNKDTDRTVTIHSIIRDIVIEKLKPDTDNCSIMVDYIYNNITYYWEYSIEGIKYRKNYFSVLKNIICLSSKYNLKTFDFIVKCISSLLTYGYTNEAKQIYDIAITFVNKLNEKEKDDFMFVLTAFNMCFENYDSVTDFIHVTQQEYQKKVRKSRELLRIYRRSIEKPIVMYPYLRFFYIYLKKIIELLRKENFKDSLFDIVNHIFDDIYECVYKGNKNEIVFQNSYIEYNIAYLEFFAHYSKGIGNIKAYEGLLNKLENYSSPEYLRVFYSYYVICKRFNQPKVAEIAEKVKKLYLDGNFKYYKYDEIKDIVEEFNLPHTEINSLEDD